MENRVPRSDLSCDVPRQLPVGHFFYSDNDRYLFLELLGELSERFDTFRHLSKKRCIFLVGWQNGCFRFLCPFCTGFDTAVNLKTNLARCFRCEKNFNTIDLVMAVRQADFVHSVKFLQSVYQKDDEHNHQDFKAIPAINRRIQTPSKSQSIKEILADVLPFTHGSISENRNVASKSNKPMDARQATTENRIAALEQKIGLLDRQIKKIAQTLDVKPASK